MTLYVGSEIQDNNIGTSSLGNIKVVGLAGGGFAIAWRYSSQDIYLRTFDADGNATSTDELHALTGAANLDWYGFDMVGSGDGGIELAWSSTGADGAGNGYGIGHLSYTDLGAVDGFQGIVNSATDGPQIYPSIAAFGDGGWISAYSSWGYGNNGSYALVVRAFNSDGTAVELNGSSNDMVVNQDLAINPTEVDIATLANGAFVVTWTSGPIGSGVTGQDGSGKGIYQRVFNPDGTPITGEAAVNLTTYGDQDYSSVTALAGGGYVVTWQDGGGNDGANHGIFQQIYSAAGAALTDADILVNTSIAGNQYSPEVAALENGGWVVVWQSFHGGDGEIYQKVYAADGSVLIDETAVSSTTGASYYPSVASLEDGGWVVSWTSVGKVAGVDQSIHHRQFGFTNEAPQGFDKSVTIREDRVTALSANYFGFSDADDNALVGVVISSLPTRGTLKLGGVAVTAGQMIDAADLGDLTYTPPANASGTGLASFGFRVVDDGGTAYGSVNTDTTANRVIFNVTEVIDIFTGTTGNNSLTGTQGVDRLQGLQGNDRLRGLGGVDTFVFSTGHDRDTIVDFDAIGTVHDILNIANLRSIASFADLKANHMKQVNSNVLIDGLGGDTITLLNVKLADLDRADFLI